MLSSPTGARVVPKGVMSMRRAITEYITSEHGDYGRFSSTRSTIMEDVSSLRRAAVGERLLWKVLRPRGWVLQKILTWKVFNQQEWILQGFNHHGTNYINKDGHIGIWTVPVLGLASDLREIKYKVEGPRMLR